MKKRVISMVICIAMLVVMFPPISASAAIKKPQLTLSYDEEYEEVVGKWTAVEGCEDVYYYDIYRAKDVSGEPGKFTKLDLRSYSGDPREFTNWIEYTGQRYYYKVVAYDRSNDKIAESNVAGINVLLPTPSIRRIVHDAETGAPMISVYYNGKPDRLDVYRAKSKTGTYSKVGSMDPGMRYIDKDAVSGTTYYYKIKSVSEDSSKFNSKLSGYKTGKKVSSNAKLAEAIEASVNSKGNLINITTLDKTLSMVSKVSITRLIGFDGGIMLKYNGDFTLSEIYDLSKIKAAGGTISDTGNAKGDPYWGETLILVKKNGNTYNEISARTYGTNILKVREGSTKSEIISLIKETARKYYSSDNWTVTVSKYSPDTINYSSEVKGLAPSYDNAVKKSGYSEYISNKYYLSIKNKNTGKKGYTFITVVPTLERISKPSITVKNLDSTQDMKVSWNKVSGADKYEVWRKVGSDGTYKKVKTTTNLYYKDTTTVKGKTYYYKVKAIKTSNSTQNSLFSASKYLTCK